MKRRDLVILLAAAVLGLLLLLVSRVFPLRLQAPTGTTLGLTAQPLVSDTQNTSTGEEGAPPEVTITPLLPGAPLPEAESYLRVKQGDDYYELVPLLSPGRLRIRQPGGEENVIDIDLNSAWMHSANCHNQDCVRQGRVTLSNRDRRVLQNMIICLPNQVSLELLSREEAQALRGKTP